jgi:DEAD/DEAH box helicase domain-containing protein
MVVSDNPLDQYFARHPEAFFGKPQENALISPGNPYILKPHLLCAAFESPITPRDEALFGEEMWPLLKDLERQNMVQERNNRWFPSTGVTYPAEGVNIRSTSDALYQVVDEKSGALLETVDSAVAYAQLHQGAVYLHQGDPYVITKLDIPSKTAFARHHAEPYYTVTRDITDIAIEKLVSRKVVGGTAVHLGQVDVSRTVVGFRKKRQFTEEVIADEPLELPTQSFVTIALWFDVPERAIEKIEALKLDLPGGLHACEHAAIGMLPFFAMCDRADIGGVSTALHPDTGKPQVFIYDGHPGGIGISERGYDRIWELWETTLKTITECPCASGCPSCIQSPKCGNNNNPLDKDAAKLLLEHLLEMDKEERLMKKLAEQRKKS